MQSRPEGTDLVVNDQLLDDIHNILHTACKQSSATIKKKKTCDSYQLQLYDYEYYRVIRLPTIRVEYRADYELYYPGRLLGKSIFKQSHYSNCFLN